MLGYTKTPLTLIYMDKNIYFLKFKLNFKCIPQKKVIQDRNTMRGFKSYLKRYRKNKKLVAHTHTK